MPPSVRPVIGRSRADCRADREHDGVVARFQFTRGQMDADLHPRPEPGAFGRHLREPAVENGLLHLEFRDAVAQQAADAVGAFVHRDRVAGARQLLRSGETGRTRAHDRDGVSGLPARDLRRHPAVVPCTVGNLMLDLLDRDRATRLRRIDREHARRFARRRAQPPGDLRKVVGCVQPLGCLSPVVPPDQVVPLGNQVPERAAVVAERNSAVHASTGLLFERWRAERGSRPRSNP